MLITWLSIKLRFCECFKFKAFENKIMKRILKYSPHLPWAAIQVNPGRWEKPPHNSSHCRKATEQVHWKITSRTRMVHPQLRLEQAWTLLAGPSLLARRCLHALSHWEVSKATLHALRPFPNGSESWSEGPGSGWMPDGGKKKCQQLCWSCPLCTGNILRSSTLGILLKMKSNNWLFHNKQTSKHWFKLMQSFQTYF